MSIFICEKCGKLDNTACNNNYWFAMMNRNLKKNGEEVRKIFNDEFEYFETHACCSDCCDGIFFRDGSGIIKKDDRDIKNKRHWSEIGIDKLLE